MSLTQLIKDVFPVVFNRDGSSFVKCELEPGSAGEDQFQSSIHFLEVITESENGKTKIALLVKFEPVSNDIRRLFNTNPQFYNEVFMYTNILPFLNKNNICGETFAKFYYGVATDDSNKSVVVLEDLRNRGYKLTDDKCFLDYDHLALAMRKLGRFHALSYTAKKQSPEEFSKLAGSLKEGLILKSKLHIAIGACLHRALDPLVQAGRHQTVLSRLLTRVDINLVQMLLDLVTPEEPLAVICHGDFCRNNLLYRYTDHGRPADVRLFDIAAARYSSPAIDIVLFLFLNCSRETRRAHRDDLLREYHAALSTAVPGAEVPSLEAIREEVRQKAIYGLIHCSFFLPMMLYSCPLPDAIVSNGSVEEMGRALSSMGGEEGTRILLDLVEELIDMECITLQHKCLSV